MPFPNRFKETSLFNGNAISGAISQAVTEAKAEIKVTTDRISSEVSRKASQTSLDGLETRVSTAESNITQNADNIELKVSETDFNGNEMIGRINLSSTTATIAADRVNISGAAIFTSGRLSESSLNDAYDAKGAASSAAATAKSEAISEAASDATSKLNSANDYTKGKAVDEEQVIWISKASGTSSVNANTTWVNETGDKQNTWSRKRPTYNESYPVVFTAKQRKTVGGTVTCTTPLKDDTTTVIDGGHITTGTIDASKATITNINADNITTGSLAADRMTSNVVSAVQSVVSDLYALVAKIGGFIIDSTSIRTAALTSNADNSIGVSTADFTRTINGTSRSGLRMAFGDKFALTGDGALYASSATVSGSITASSGSVGGFTVDSTSVRTAALTSNADNSIGLSTADFKRTINGTSRSGLRFAIGDKLGVTGDGAIYASSATVSGNITATSGTIGGASIDSNGKLQVPAAQIDGKLTASQINASGLSIGISQVTDLSGELDSAAKTATNFVTEINEHGIWVTPRSNKPTNGSVTQSTSGWHIADALELFKFGVRYIKAWLNGPVPTLRLGQDSSGHTDVTPYGMDVYADSTKKLAKFGCSGTLEVVENYGSMLVEAGLASVQAWTRMTAPDITNVKAYLLVGSSYEELPYGANTGADVYYTKSIDSHTVSFEVVNNSSSDVTVFVGEVRSTIDSGTTEIVMGDENEGYAVIDYRSMMLVDSGGEVYFDARDLRSTDGLADLVTEFVGDGSRTTFELWPAAANTNYTVSVSDSSGGTVTKSKGSIRFSSAPTSSSTITVSYKTDKSTAKSFTFGSRTGNVGGMSFAAGRSACASGGVSSATGLAARASGTASHAEGSYTVASGKSSHAEGDSSRAETHYAHAEGNETIAKGIAAHAEGFMCTASGYASHCEGEECTASGTGSHAEGCDTTAAGSYSHASGRGTYAAGGNQAVFGKYNQKDKSGTYAFIVGKGSSDSSRSDAFRIDWSGNAWIAGTLTQASDARLKEHVSYLSDDAVRFVRDLEPALYRKDGEHVGFYAQDVRDADPWCALVEEGPDGYLSLDYQGLIAPLVAYCQHLERRIEALEGGE